MFDSVPIAPLRQKHNFNLPLLISLLHIPLGLLLYRSSALAFIHPAAVFLFGLRCALKSEEKLERVAFIAAYIIGAEVLWRMAQAPIWWESGKYAAALIMITALVRRGLWKIPVLPLFYFVFLLPSCLLTVAEKSLGDAKDTISFNLSGPFLLLISCWFFSNLTLNHPQIRKLLLYMIVPLLSVAITTVFYTVSTPEIQFNGESNFATSGGFGPNQVSAMLGLGVFLCVTCFLLFRNTLDYTVYFGALAVLFAAQSVLTFSRGGMYNAIGAVLMVVLFQLRNLNENIKRLLPILGIALIFLLVVFPFLNNFTGGALQDRFEDSDPTKRSDIVLADLRIFAENPILGVGLGNAYSERAKFLNDEKAASHTEFARLVAEHGTFGILALCALILMIIYNLTKQEANFGKALAAGFVAWSVLFMLNAGMRLAAPSFVWGMSFMIVTNLPFYKQRFANSVKQVIRN